MNLRSMKYTAEHTGTEFFRVKIGLDLADSSHDIEGEHVTFVFRPRLIVLAWVRELGGEWTPFSYYPSFAGERGSKIYGPRIRKDGDFSASQDSYRDVWNFRGELTPYAQTFEWLPDFIAELEFPA